MTTPLPPLPPLQPHVHEPFRCPAHVGGCDCPELPGRVCNPYHAAGYCPEELEVMS